MSKGILCSSVKCFVASAHIQGGYNGRNECAEIVTPLARLPNIPELPRNSTIILSAQAGLILDVSYTKKPSHWCQTKPFQAYVKF